MRKKLKLETLTVTSFETSTASVPLQPAGDSGLECDSPLCGPTYWKTCETGTA
jgi:hypothetical protein